MSIFGDRLRAARRARGMTEQALSEASGVRRPTISELETGKRTVVTTTTAVALARTLNVSLDWLLGVWDYIESPASEGETESELTAAAAQQA